MLTFLVTWSTLGSISNIFNVLKHFFYKSNCNKYCKDIVWFLSLKGNKIQAKKVQYNEFVESGLENYSLISWITIIVNQDDKKTKINWFYPKKIIISSIQGGQFLYIFFLNLITSLVLVVIVFSSQFSDPPCLGASFSLTVSSSFDLYPPRVDQVANFDPCPINIFLKSLGVVVRLKIIVQVSLPY